jgi:hypothetical protein
LTQAGPVFGARFFADVVSGSVWDGRAGFFKLIEARGSLFSLNTLLAFRISRVRLNSDALVSNRILPGFHSGRFQHDGSSFPASVEQ